MALLEVNNLKKVYTTVLFGYEVSKMEERLLPIAHKLGIVELLEKYPYEISGGQKQRTAVA